MHWRYDTRTVHPLDRYDHYREGAGSELAPFQVLGRRPDRMFVSMSASRCGDLTFESLVFAADSEIEVRRTARVVRASDPECYQCCPQCSGLQAGGEADLPA